jgi:hypothetical protein
MSVQSWLDRNASLREAHEKYGQEFEAAYRIFRSDFFEADCPERAALWSDPKNCGENLMAWYRARQC